MKGEAEVRELIVVNQRKRSSYSKQREPKKVMSIQLRKFRTGRNPGSGRENEEENDGSANSNS